MLGLLSFFMFLSLMNFRGSIAANVLPLAAGGDLEARNCQPALNLSRSTKLQVCTSPPLAANGCSSDTAGESSIKYCCME
jgi:hypothetical protein